MANDIYVDSVSPTGLHQCIAEGDGRSVWMYLHDLRERTVVADAPICSLADLVALSHFKETYKGDGAAPLVKEYSTARAVNTDLTNAMIAFQWANDGASVVALVEGEPCSMVVAGEKRGYSKALSKEGPFGQPWNQTQFDKAFKEHS